jgi:outer membrane protein TolC
MIALVALLVMAGAPNPGAPLSEDQAVALALENSPEIRWRVHAIEESQALAQAGLAWNNPLLRVAGLRYDQLVEPAIEGENYGDHPFDHTTVALRWSPPGLGERALRRAEGRALEAEARSALAIARRDTAALVRKLHAQISSYDAQLALVRGVVEQRESLRALVERRLELQAATLLDQSLIDVDYLDARTQLVELETRRRAAYHQLLIQVGLPAGSTIALAPSKSGCSAPGEIGQLTERAWRANPRLHLLEAQLDAVAAERSRRWLELWPWFDYAQVGYGMAGNNHSGYIAFQLQITLPLLDWKGPHRRALQAREHALAERMQTENRTLSELVLRASAQLAEQAALVERYRETASVVERGAASLRKALAQNGPTNLFEVALLQARLLVTRRAYLRAQLECRLEQIEIDRLVGTSVGKED